MTTTKNKGCLRLIPLYLMVSVLVLFAGCSPSASPGVPQTLCGTYTSGEADLQVILSVDDENRVYYADQKNDLFILGSIQPQGEDTYLLSCEDPNKADIIPDQEVSFDGESLSLSVGEHQYEFQKVDDIPTIVGDISRYS